MLFDKNFKCLCEFIGCEVVECNCRLPVFYFFLMKRRAKWGRLGVVSLAAGGLDCNGWSGLSGAILCCK